jgi:hypothetical protein
MVTVVSVDFAFWTEDLAGAVTTFIEAVADEPAEARELWLRGQASPRFERELARRGWTVRKAVELEPEKAGSVTGT